MLDAGRKQRPGQLFMQLRGKFAHLKHVAKNGNAPAVALRFRFRQHGNRRAHGSGVGVIAFIDQQERTAFNRQTVALTAPFHRLKRSERFKSAVEIGAGHGDGTEHGHGVVGDVTSGNIEMQFAGLAVQDRPDGRTRRRAFKVGEPEIGLGVLPEGQDVLYTLFLCGLFKLLELGIVAVEDDGAALLKPFEYFRLGRGDLFNILEIAEMGGSDGRDDRHMRTHHLDQRANFAGVVHADFKTPNSVSAGIRASVSGTPQ